MVARGFIAWTPRLSSLLTPHERGSALQFSSESHCLINNVIGRQRIDRSRRTCTRARARPLRGSPPNLSNIRAITNSDIWTRASPPATTIMLLQSANIPLMGHRWRFYRRYCRPRLKRANFDKTRIRIRINRPFKLMRLRSWEVFPRSGVIWKYRITPGIIRMSLTRY
jgi:hypothetical protein